jgi:signal peptidase II
MRLLTKTPFHALLLVVCVALDQVTKIFMEGYLRAQGGSVDVLGSFLRFSLAYNEGAAFSIRPHEILPFLTPTMFFGTLTVVALAGLAWFYRTLPQNQVAERLGIALICSGAVGNFCDRLRIGRVVDWIDCDFPDFIFTRWPTFNLADSWVTIGIALVLVSSLLAARRPPQS